MSPQQRTALSVTRRRLLFGIFAAAAIFLIKALDILGPSLAQEPKDATQEIKETVFEDEIPRHVPIRIKIRKEKEAAFKNLKNERWARDFELEVTNTGAKPIYTLSLLLVTDLKAAAGFRIVAPLFYGKLGELTNKAEPEDVPIKPGETYIFKIYPGQLDAWDTIQRTEHRPHPKTIQIKFELLSFGDGTAIVGEDGEGLCTKSRF
jgi:hypothetical protein